jgi:hypothetical protein
MLAVNWGKEAAEDAYATYIGRSGCKTCKGVEVHITPGKRITLCPLNVDNCQIDIPADQVDAVIAALQKAKAAVTPTETV